MVSQILLSKGRVAPVDDELFEWLSRYRWYVTSKGYAAATIEGKQVYMHRLIMNAQPGEIVDHQNGSRLDNRRDNLRIVTPMQSQWNRRPSGTSRYKGVSYHKGNRGWAARIQSHGHRITLGYFQEPVHAAMAWNTAASILHGEYAWLNPLGEPVPDWIVEKVASVLATPVGAQNSVTISGGSSSVDWNKLLYSGCDCIPVHKSQRNHLHCVRTVPDGYVR